MPEIVIEVSATFVARMTLRVLGGAMLNALFCSEGVRRAYRGQTNSWKAGRPESDTEDIYLIGDECIPASS